MPRDATAMVIAFDDRPEMMQPWTSDANLLRNAIDNVQPTDRKTKLKLAYQLAEAQAVLHPRAEPQQRRRRRTCGCSPTGGCSTRRS